MAKLQISEYAKQILMLMYKEERDNPGASFNSLSIDEDGLDTDEEKEELANAIAKIVDSNARVIQSLEYLIDSGYVRTQRRQATDNEAVYSRIKLTALGADFAEGVARGNSQNIKQAGLIINGDVNIELESLGKIELSDIFGLDSLNSLVKFIKSCSKAS